MQIKKGTPKSALLNRLNLLIDLTGFGLAAAVLLRLVGAAVVAVLTGLLGLFAGADRQTIVCGGTIAANRLRSRSAITMSVAMTRADQEALVEVVQALAINGRRNDTNNRSRAAIAISHDGLRLKLRVLLLVLVEFFSHFVDETLVVLGMLQVALRENAVAGGSGITRERDVFLIDLVGGAADAHIGTIAVEGLNAGIDAAAHLVIPMSVSAVVPIATVTSTVTAHTSCVLIVSHADFFFTSFSFIGTAFQSLRELLLNLWPWCISCYKASVMSSEIGDSM